MRICTGFLVSGVTFVGDCVPGFWEVMTTPSGCVRVVVFVAIVGLTLATVGLAVGFTDGLIEGVAEGLPVGWVFVVATVGLTKDGVAVFFAGEFPDFESVGETCFV